MIEISIHFFTDHLLERSRQIFAAANSERFRSSEGMASTPGRHDEVHNFVRKLLSLHGAGRKARLNLDCHGGELWVTLHAELGEQLGQAVPLLPQHGPVPAKPNHPAAAAREVGLAGKLGGPDVCSLPSLLPPGG